MEHDPVRAFASTTLQEGRRILAGLDAAACNERTSLAREELTYLLRHQVQAVGDLTRLPTLDEAMRWCQAIVAECETGLDTIADWQSAITRGPSCPLVGVTLSVYGAIVAGHGTATHAAEAVGCTVQQARSAIATLTRRGSIVRLGLGRYAAADERSVA